MKTSQALTMGFITMLVLNAFLIYRLSTVPVRPTNKDIPANQLFEEISTSLGLSAVQKDLYTQLAADHRENMKVLNQQQADFLRSYFETLRSNNHGEANELIEKILTLEKSKLQITYTHFEELKQHLDTEQQQQFDLVIDDLLKVLLKQPANPPPPPGHRPPRP